MLAGERSDLTRENGDAFRPHTVPSVMLSSQGYGVIRLMVSCAGVMTWVGRKSKLLNDILERYKH